MKMALLYSPGIMLNTAQAVIAPLKDGISSLNGVYDGLIKADVDPVTGQSSNYDYIRQQIVQAHQHLQSSEQTASSGLKSLDGNLERLIQEEGQLEREKSNTTIHLANLITERESNEKLLRDSNGALGQAREHLDSAKQTLQNMENKKETLTIVTGVGAGVALIPFLRWILGPTMMIGGAVDLGEAVRAINWASEEVRKSYNEVKTYESKTSEYESKISQIRHDISQKDYELMLIHEDIQKVKNQIRSVADFQQKVRSAVHLLGVLSGRVSVAEHQTRSFILQEPVMKVMEEVMKATEQVAGNKLLYDNDMPRLIDQMKENHQRLAAICDSEQKPSYLDNYY